MRRWLFIPLVALAGCSRPPPPLDPGEAAALGEILASAGTSLDRTAVTDDLYEFTWRGAEEHANARHLPDQAEKARKLRDDVRDAVAIEKGHVVALRVKGVKLTSLAPVTKLPHLVVLDLHDGALVDTTGLDTLTELDHLGLAGNQLTSVAAVSNLPRLRSVYLADNPIGSLEGFVGLPELEVLNASGTRVTTIAGLDALPKLKALSLEHTRVSRIEGLDAAPLLEDLDLARCPIQRIENLGSAKRLKFLNLWHDQIRFIAGLEEASPTLIYVGLGENPYDFGDPTNMRVLAQVSPGRIVTVL